MPIGPEFNPATAVGALNRPAVSISIQFYLLFSFCAHEDINEMNDQIRNSNFQ